MNLSIWQTRGLLIVLMLVAFLVALSTSKPALRQSQTRVLSQTAMQDSQIKAQLQIKQKHEIVAPIIYRSSLSSNQARQPGYSPRYEFAWAHPVNYGERDPKDINGLSVNNKPIIVIHETVDSAASAINHFQTPHENENTQASYHTLIKLDGTVVYLVPPEKRAFGAGNSVFEGEQGAETVKTHANFPPSVNNFAYHVSLETPPDGRNNNYSHSGYTDAQYQSLVWLIAQSNVPDSRITTHQAVDRSGERIDPRSFDFKKFQQLLAYYRQTNRSDDERR